MRKPYFAKTFSRQSLTIGALAVSVIGNVFAVANSVTDFDKKLEAAKAFSLVKDNPSGILTVRDLRALPDGRHLYDVSYIITLKNTTDHDFDVDFSVDQVYLGDLREDQQKGNAKINNPQGIWDDPDDPDHGEDGDVVWKLMKSRTSVIGDSGDCNGKGVLVEKDLVKDKIISASADDEESCIYDVDYFGGMTGTYFPEHADGHSAHYIIAATPDNYIGVTTTYGIAPSLSILDRIRGTHRSSLDDANANGEIALLRDATNAKKCPFGVITQNGITKSAC
jgi:hypothetical protein